MTAATLALPLALPLATPGGVVADADLWFGGQQDPVGLDYDHSRPGRQPQPDPLRYVVWVAPRPPSGELGPRMALHVNHVGRWTL
jgi:hypothetical protein